MQRWKSCPPALAGNSKGAKRPRAFPSGDEPKHSANSYQPVVRRPVWGLSGRPQAPSECKLIQSVETTQTNVREHLTSQRIKNARVPRYITPSRPRRGVPATARNQPKPPRGGAQRELKRKCGGRGFCAKRRNLKLAPQSPCIFEKKYYNNN